MLDWCPKSTGTTKRRWQSTSKAKSGPCVSHNPLEELRETAKKRVLGSPFVASIQVKFDGPAPAQEDLLVLLGMWVRIAVMGEACGPYDLLCDLAPMMLDERRDAWAEMYERMTITTKEA